MVQWSIKGYNVSKYGAKTEQDLKYGFHSIEIESDSMEVITASTGQERIWNEASVIYVECFIIARMIGPVHYLYCVREVNEVAHSLAKFAYDNNIFCNWVNEPPDFLANGLANNETIFRNQ